MSTMQVNDIVEYLSNNGLTPEDIENDGDYTSLEYDSFWVDVCCEDDRVNAELSIALSYRFTFDQACSYFLNSFATDWEIYKGYLKIVFNVRNAQELEKTLKSCIKEFNVELERK